MTPNRLGRFRAGIWSGWQERGKRPSQVLLLAAGVTSFLSAAATIHALYTLQLSFILAAAGAVVGAPWLISGWSNADGWLRWSSLALIALYVLSLAVGHPGTVPGSHRTGRVREVVYVADLCVGMAAAGVIAGLWGDRSRSWAMSYALIAGVILGGAYAVYQWLGLHFHWPLTHLNNTLNSNGVTSGASQGIGLLGWERAQGTFLEPHFLGYFVASLWPLCAGAAFAAKQRWAKWGLWAAALLLLVGLLATDSVPAWGSLIVACVAAVGILAMAQGKPALAAVTVASVVGLFALLPVTGIQRGAAATTNRSVASVKMTTQFRTATWHRALDLWAERPILGAGPGQASVRLTLAGVDVALFPRPAPGVLLSAQGLWVAALLDVGLLGLAAWLLFLAGVVHATARSVFFRRNYHTASLLAAVVIAVLGSVTVGDRLELWVWLVLGAALAASSDSGRSATRNRGQ